MKRDRLLTALVVAGALGIGLLVLQRWVAQTRIVAMALVAAWFVVVAIGILIALRGRPDLRRPALATFAVIAVASAGIGYWTAFRDKKVDEDVVVATREATTQEREEGLSIQLVDEPTGKPKPKPTKPIMLAAGALVGADGHAASGKVTLIREPDGRRRLTLTNFDADPGPQVVVYLSPTEEKTDDVVELGGLKGNIGNQQYRIPDSADLKRFDTLILWCVPFTTRIAFAALR